MNFNTFIGQKRIKGILQDSLKAGKLSHAYSFEGPAGMGKLSLAKVFAAAILCHRQEGEACGECLSCRKLLSGNHPDFTLVSPEKSSLGIDGIRNLQEQVIIKPIESDRKVYIIDQGDKMTTQAQNCLLKTLEEPPLYVTLILGVSNSNAILKTIQSRCTRIKFDIYNDEDIKAIISAKGINKNAVADFAVAFSQGIVGKAFSIISDDFLGLREQVFDILAGIEQCEIEELLKISTFFEDNKNFIEDIFDIIITWYRDIILSKTLVNGKELINYDKQGIILKNVLNYSRDDLIKVIKIVEETRKNIKMNISFQMAIDNMLLSIWEVYNGKSCRSAV